MSGFHGEGPAQAGEAQAMAGDGRRRQRVRRTAWTGLTAVALAAALAACGSSSGSGGSGSSGSSGATTATISGGTDSASGPANRGSVLTMAFTGAPISLNPQLGGDGPDGLFPALAYDTLTWIDTTGKLHPDLATSWRYVGTGNTTFELTLRPHVKFQDGTTMTAQSVVSSMKAFIKASPNNANTTAGEIASIKAAGPLKVVVHYAVPNPDAAETMDQNWYIGFIIGPKGLASPKSLLTSSDGTGQYRYDASKSADNSVYYYTKNPTYWNPKAQMFSAVAVKDILNPSATLSAATTGQVQWALGSGTTVSAARSAGLQVVQAPFFNWGLTLSLRDGSISKPLANPKVREAIGYALNRPELASAIGSSYATPSNQILLPGTDGYEPTAGFSYDTAKAKSLLAQAGYPHGFPLTVLTEATLDPNTQYSQALASALGQIGIKATLHVAPFTQFISDTFAKKYAAIVYPSAGADMWQVAQQVLPVSLYNPAGEPTPATLKAVLAKAYASGSAAQRTKLYRHASVEFKQMGWFIPAFSTEEVTYVSKKLAGVKASVLVPESFPTSPDPALAWYLTS